MTEQLAAAKQIKHCVICIRGDLDDSPDAFNRFTERRVRENLDEILWLLEWGPRLEGEPKASRAFDSELRLLEARRALDRQLCQLGRAVVKFGNLILSRTYEWSEKCKLY